MVTSGFIWGGFRFMSIHLVLLMVGVTTDDAHAGVRVALGLSRYPIAPLDNDVLTIRLSMQRAIFVNIAKQNPLPTDDASKAKYASAATRLEEGLFKMAMTKEDYLNPSTFESRLTSLLKGRQLNDYNQQHAITTTLGVSAEPTMRSVRDRDCREA